MSKVAGLRPTDADRPELRQKKGRVTTLRSQAPTVGLTPSASPVSTYVRPMAPPEDQSLGQLADALSSVNQRLEKWAAGKQENLEKEQWAKRRWYAEQFMKDREIGSVNAAQLKEVFPEMVPTVATRIADVIGKMEAKDWAETEIQEILQNDELRLNTQARQEAIKGVYARANEVIAGQDNEFYASGFLTQLDSTLGQYEMSWLQETAKYHEDKQKEGFSHEILESFVSGGDPMAVDAAWGQTSSLSNVERKEVAVTTFLDHAYATGDASVLDRIPDVFLNAEYKANIMKAKFQIQDMKWDQYRKGKELDEYQRTLEIRQGKIEGLDIFVRDGYVDPSPFRNQPQVYDYLSSLNKTGNPVRQADSAATATKLRTYVMAAGTTGGWTKAFSNDPGLAAAFKDDGDVTMEALIDHVSTRTDINAAEKVAFIHDTPKLMEGVNWMRDPDTTSVYRTVEKDLTDYLGSIPGGVLKKMSVTPRNRLENVFYTTLRRGMTEYAEENDGKLPMGQAKKKIVDDANEAAEKYLIEIKADFKGQVQESPLVGGVPSVDERKATIDRKKKEAEAGMGYTTITVDGKEVKIPKRKAE